MTTNKPALAPPEKIVPALVHHYTPDEPGPNVTDSARLKTLLEKLPSLSNEDTVDTIAALLKRYEPGSSFSREDIAVIAFVDDAVTSYLKQTDLDFRIEPFVRGIAPRIAALAFESDIHAVTKPHKLFDLVDLIVRECIGWSEDLGILGEQFIEKISPVITGHASGRLTTDQCMEDLQKVFKKEEPIFEKLEQRLIDRELKVLGGKKGKYHAAEFLNREMTGNQMPLFVIFMFQGAWYDFMQMIFVAYGEKSKEWENVKKLTEAMIWTLQPGKDKEKRLQMIGNLPKQIRTFCENMKFETGFVVESLADLEAEWDAIKGNDPSDPCDFEPIDVDENMAASMQEATRDAVAKIRDVELGSWYLYDDPTEPDEKVARIKLILNWQETEQLLLTNHKRRKVVHLSYGEMVNHIGSGIMKELIPAKSSAEVFLSHMFEVLRSVSTQNKKEKQIEVREERRAISEEYNQERKEDLERQLALSQEQAEKKKRAMVLMHKAEKKMEAAESTVTALKQDAWVKLPIMEGTLTPCKLVAIIPANKTYIFANRAGLKVAEYTASQLAHMIVTENSEILDTGAEFESALATVVSGLREDKNKSYDELTGSKE
ncbi:MAG: DUF1631 family protein [Pseudomonadales bacterium]|nr:DUF1631 family protein [Pseudomonadales bacterium]